ncbi:class V lanthionine synthetase subunit LxmK [Kitasatospora sp. NPDC018619]|uniref:class V lanthionine synthetase subunit LxmK n=1 Tax=unclassified Kitasatospora TaxID=2633591 RepID=UPI003790B7F0
MAATITAIRDTAGTPTGPAPDTDPTGVFAPVPLDHVPEVVHALERLGVAPFADRTLTSRAGRNDNWAGPTTDGREVFVKRLAPPLAAERFDRARAFERALAAGRPPEHWRSPAFLGADPVALLLVHERLADAVPGNLLADQGRFDAALSHRAGLALAELHRLPVAPADLPQPATGGPERAADRVAELTAENYAAASGGELEVWAMLQHDKRVRAALRELADASAAAPAVPVHGDLRLDQFLLSGEELYLTDWEEFRIADAARDVGAYVGQWLHRAATGMFAGLGPDTPASPAEVHEALMRSGTEQLDAVRPQIAAFWSGYRRGRTRPSPDEEQFTVRVTRYAGWHLFERTLATAAFTHRLSAALRGAAGVGRNALLDPLRSAAVLGLVQD